MEALDLHGFHAFGIGAGDIFRRTVDVFFASSSYEDEQYPAGSWQYPPSTIF